MALFGRYFRYDETARRAAILRSLINQESRLGGAIFGTPRHGGRQEFFLSPTHNNEWIWHQETPDGSKSMTVRYILMPNKGVYKSIDGQPYEQVVAEEKTHLFDAIHTYHSVVMKNLYSKHAA